MQVEKYGRARLDANSVNFRPFEDSRGIHHNSLSVVLEYCEAVTLHNQTLNKNAGFEALAYEALKYLSYSVPYKTQFTLDVRNPSFSLLGLICD